MIDIREVLDNLNINHVVSRDNPIAIDVEALTDEHVRVLLDLLHQKQKADRKNVKEVRDAIHQEIGYCHCYVNYWHCPWDEEQERRIDKLIKRYSEEWTDNINNLLWHQEILSLIQDEIENMC